MHSCDSTRKPGIDETPRPRMRCRAPSPLGSHVNNCGPGPGWDKIIHAISSAKGVMLKFLSVISKLEVWAWACICATLMALCLYPGFVPKLSNDAFQYL